MSGVLMYALVGGVAALVALIIQAIDRRLLSVRKDDGHGKDNGHE